MRTLHFAIPGSLSTPTGGYAYARRLIGELPRLGWRVETVALPAGFPFADAAALSATQARLAAVPQGATVLVDGLAFGTMGGIAARLAGRLDIVALVHHPLADETGLAAETAAAFESSERAALAVARAVICTSRTTAQRLVEGFGVDRRRITVALPGTDRRARSKGGDAMPLVLSLGALVPRKGHDVLLRALGKLSGLPWKARIVGTDDRDPVCAAGLIALARALRLDDRVTFAGAVADAPAEFERADIFALASWHEGYGMAFAEALAHGLPVVGCRAGAVPEVVPEEAGVLVTPGDADAFAMALEPLLAEPAVRRARSEAAWRAGGALPEWRETASVVAACLAGTAGV